jgi:hypothetical protein
MKGILEVIRDVADWLTLNLAATSSQCADGRHAACRTILSVPYWAEGPLCYCKCHFPAN